MKQVSAKRLIKKILFRFMYPVSQWYLSKERNYTYRNIQLKVMPGVFHPGLFFSTKILLEYLETIELRNKTFLELGAGTGLISIFAARDGAQITSLDISSVATKNIKINAANNNVELDVIQSDLFDKISRHSFDVVVINPPYFPGDPKNEKEYAWFCGSDFQFFSKLFGQLGNYIDENSKVIMILSEDSDIDRIKNMAQNSNFDFEEIYRKRVWAEWNYLFRIKKL